MERILIAILTSGLGFLTGILIVYTASRLPGVELSGSIYLFIATTLALFSGGYCYMNMDKTIDMLGKVWSMLGSIYSIITTLRNATRH